MAGAVRNLGGGGGMGWDWFGWVCLGFPLAFPQEGHPAPRAGWEALLDHAARVPAVWEGQCQAAGHSEDSEYETEDRAGPLH